MSVVWGQRVRLRTPLAPRESPFTLIQGAFVCDNCFKVSAATMATPRSVSSPLGQDGVDAEFSIDPDAPTWWPAAGETPKIEDVPSHVAMAAEEAYRCASVGAYMAAILMARTVIEATAKAKEIMDGSLIVKIDAMRTANLLRPGIAEAAHEIRHLGNNMAHGDLDDLPEKQDADDILVLMSQVLSEVFQGPALLEKVKARRTGAVVDSGS